MCRLFREVGGIFFSNLARICLLCCKVQYSFNETKNLQVLAKNRMFLIITSLFQKFRFYPTEGKMAPNHDPRSYGFASVIEIKNYEIIAKSRMVREN